MPSEYLRWEDMLEPRQPMCSARLIGCGFPPWPSAKPPDAICCKDNEGWRGVAYGLATEPKVSDVPARDPSNELVAVPKQGRWTRRYKKQEHPMALFAEHRAGE